MKLGGITEAARAEVEHHGCLCLQPILCGTKQRQLTSVHQVMYNQPLYCPRQIPLSRHVAYRQMVLFKTDSDGLCHIWVAVR